MSDAHLSNAGDDEWSGSPEAAKVAEVEQAERAKFAARRAAQESAKRTIRLSLDLTPDMHRQLGQLALDNGTDKSALLRTTLRLLFANPEWREAVVKQLGEE